MPRLCGSLSPDLSGFAVVFTFFDFLDDLGDKRIQIFRGTAGDVALVHDDFAVLVMRTGVFHIRRD